MKEEVTPEEAANFLFKTAADVANAGLALGKFINSLTWGKVLIGLLCIIAIAVAYVAVAIMTPFP